MTDLETILRINRRGERTMWFFIGGLFIGANVGLLVSAMLRAAAKETNENAGTHPTDR